jgi:predicted ATPase
MSSTVHVSAFQLPSSAIFDAYATENAENSLDRLGAVNLFVGSNNSGKSRFLRTLFAVHDLHYATDKYDPASFRSFIDELAQAVYRIVPRKLSSRMRQFLFRIKL